MDYNDVTDEQLLHMVREESEEAKDVLYERYKYIIDAELKKYNRMAWALSYDVNDLYHEKKTKNVNKVDVVIVKGQNQNEAIIEEDNNSKEAFIKQ